MAARDFTGKTIDIGDHVFYSTTGRWAESRVVEITRFTPKNFPVGKIVKRNRYGFLDDQEIIIKNDFVKIDYGTTERF